MSQCWARRDLKDPTEESRVACTENLEPLEQRMLIFTASPSDPQAAAALFSLFFELSPSLFPATLASPPPILNCSTGDSPQQSQFHRTAIETQGCDFELPINLEEEEHNRCPSSLRWRIERHKEETDWGFFFPIWIYIFFIYIIRSILFLFIIYSYFKRMRNKCRERWRVTTNSNPRCPTGPWTSEKQF